MKVLLYGHKGWICGMFVKIWESIYPQDELIRGECRLTFENVDSIQQEISKVDRVVCMIGRTYGKGEDGKLINNIDYLEDHLQENLNDNLAMPLLLALLCKNQGVHLSYLGTGCIFSRNTWENDYSYTEEDRPDYFGSSYSVVKGATDNLIKQFPDVLNWRIRMPITNDRHPRNFISKILGYKKICNFPNSMTYLPDLLPIMVEMSRRRIVGTFNMVNDGLTSHCEILELYRECRPEHKYELITETQLDGLLKSKRSNNELNTDKLKKLLREEKIGYTLRHIRDCVKDAIKGALSTSEERTE